MLKKLKKITRNEFRKSNLKSFLFFLAFSSIIWLLVQFSKHYTEVLSVPVIYQNFPQDKIIDKKKDTLELKVDQSGFQIAWFKLFRPELNIDLSKLPADSINLLYSIRDHRDFLIKELPLDVRNIDFLDRELTIPYKEKNTKVVPVFSHIDIDFAPGYSSENEVKIIPDSVHIIGPENLLDTISKVYTKSLTKENVKNDLNDVVGLDNSKYPDLSFGRNKVNYSLKVEKFTERKLNVPLKVINAPKGMTISLYPAEVMITFKVSLKRFNQIQGIDFDVVCDYKDLIENQNFFIPKIVSKPDVVKNVRLSPRKIQFVIKK